MTTTIKKLSDEFETFKTESKQKLDALIKPRTIKIHIPETTIELAPDEIYIGLIGTEAERHHFILLAGDKDDGNWQDAMDWAKEIEGGDLPDRIELAILNAYFSDKFKEDWYWSNTTHASNADYAWYQSFTNGSQNLIRKSPGYCRARRVRRVFI